MAKIIYIIKNEGEKKLRELACRGKEANRIIVSCEQGRESLEAWGGGQDEYKKIFSKTLDRGSTTNFFFFYMFIFK